MLSYYSMLENISVFLSGLLTAVLKKVKRFQQDIKKTL